MTFQYEGSELELFARATNWKRYWSALVWPYVRGSVLEVGAGIGSTSRLFADSCVDSWLALEPDSELASRIGHEAASGSYPMNLSVRVGTLESLEDELRFDLVMYIDVLEHIADDAGELARAARLLRPGGHIVVLAPAHQSLFSEFDASIGHFRRYDRDSLSALTPEGVVLDHVRYLDSVGLLASAGNRFLLRSSSPTRSQILLWDRVFVPASVVIDRLSWNRFGKSVMAVFRAP